MSFESNPRLVFEEADPDVFCVSCEVCFRAKTGGEVILRCSEDEISRLVAVLVRSGIEKFEVKHLSQLQQYLRDY